MQEELEGRGGAQQSNVHVGALTQKPRRQALSVAATLHRLPLPRHAKASESSEAQPGEATRGVGDVNQRPEGARASTRMLVGIPEDLYRDALDGRRVAEEKGGRLLGGPVAAWDSLRGLDYRIARGKGMLGHALSLAAFFPGPGGITCVAYAADRVRLQTPASPTLDGWRVGGRKGLPPMSA